MKRLLGIAASLCLLAGLARAQETKVPPKTIAVKAAHLIDAKAGRVLDQQVVLIVGERIEKVGPAKEIQVPAGATVIDLGSATLLPGLIDAHVHLTGDPQHSGYKSLGISVPRQTLTGAKNARLTLEVGFTTVSNVGAAG